ncbi:MAG: response regulator [Kiritimatiellae bacterium]|nr:response regulator [Kiritimatiellia bacterium]
MSSSLIKALLIEDNPDDARMILDMVKEASNGPMDMIHAKCLGEGKKIMALGRFDVVLLDLNLPDSAAWDTVAQADQMVSSIPIIVLTGLDDGALANNIIDNGIQDYLIKGQFDCRLLCRSIHYAIERKRVLLKKDKLLAELRATLALVNRLCGPLPICAACKKMRDNQGCWHQVEDYIHDHFEAIFTHAICPDCSQRLYPDLFPNPPKEKEDVAAEVGNDSQSGKKQDKRACRDLSVSTSGRLIG